MDPGLSEDALRALRWIAEVEDDPERRLYLSQGPLIIELAAKEGLFLPDTGQTAADRLTAAVHELRAVGAVKYEISTS